MFDCHKHFYMFETKKKLRQKDKKSTTTTKIT